MRKSAILEEHEIDSYTSPDNLMFAPNRGHSNEYAEHVNELLRRAVADGGGDFETIQGNIRETLRQAGRDFLKNDFPLGVLP